ncbi:MAG: aldehyde dehydrogenase family protein [Ilumatobacteraceae bacterium]|nr:aldehyde dehydrogenase family protein [Ilumatobacteraceae bacterium]
MPDKHVLRTGDRVLVGETLIVVDQQFADSLEAGDTVVGLASRAVLRCIPLSVATLVHEAVTQAKHAFSELGSVKDDVITDFFRLAALLLEDDLVFKPIGLANELDVKDAQSRKRSTSRLVLTDSMRSDMIEAFKLWRDLALHQQELLARVEHDGWSVEQWRSPLGVVGFVFEGRPNVFADATGVLRSGNTVVFRIGSDALRTARALMTHVIEPALAQSGLPAGCVVLVESRQHAAGWALFNDPRLALAVARGSGEAVAELGSIAQQAGTAVSLHGTGGAWMIVGEKADVDRLGQVVEHSLDRKVCNTLNTVCVVSGAMSTQIPVIIQAAQRAASQRQGTIRVHATKEALATVSLYCHDAELISESDLAKEFEWEDVPEFAIVTVDTVDNAVRLCNQYSPNFVVSVITSDAGEKEQVWKTVNAPFVGDGFTRWVDGQFALLRPELGLSNWQHGRLFSRGGVMSGDSVFTVRLKVAQQRPGLHR